MFTNSVLVWSFLYDPVTGNKGSDVRSYSFPWHSLVTDPAGRERSFLSFLSPAPTQLLSSKGSFCLCQVVSHILGKGFCCTAINQVTCCKLWSVKHRAGQRKSRKLPLLVCSPVASPPWKTHPNDMWRDFFLHTNFVNVGAETDNTLSSAVIFLPGQPLRKSVQNLLW